MARKAVELKYFFGDDLPKNELEKRKNYISHHWYFAFPHVLSQERQL